MHYSDVDPDCERVQQLIDHIEQNAIRVYRWAFENCEYAAISGSGDCPSWVFNKVRQILEEITEIQEIIRKWEE